MIAALALSAMQLVVTARAQTIELKVSHYVPPNHTAHLALEAWSKELAEKSAGRLKLTIFPSGQMAPMPRQYDLARMGVADIVYFLHGGLPGRFPLTEVAQLPYAFSRTTAGVPKAMSTSQASVILTELIPRLAAEHEGVKPLMLIATPTLSLFFSKGPVRSPADMKGLRMRHNGPIGAAMLDAWGAASAAIAPAELADALSKGVIGGTLFNYEAAKAFQMAESIKSVTQLDAAAATFGLVMNLDRYNALPADLRKLIDDTTGSAMARRIGAAFDDAEAEGRRYLEAAKVQIVQLTAAEAKAFQDSVSATTDALLAKASARAPGKAKELLDEIKTMAAAAK
jgi:TRAP-type transport system periplasmic protein